MIDLALSLLLGIFVKIAVIWVVLSVGSGVVLGVVLLLGLVEKWIAELRWRRAGSPERPPSEGEFLEV